MADTSSAASLPAAAGPQTAADRRRVFLVIGVVALAARVIGALLHGGESFRQADELSYLQLATELAGSGRYAAGPAATPEIIRGPMYTAFLAAWVALVGPSERVLLVIQSLCGVGTVLLLSTQLGRSMRLSGLSEAVASRAERLCGVALALSPFALLHERLLMSEGLSTLVLSASLVAWMRSREASAPRERLLWALACGVSFGVLSLGKSAMILLPIALLLIDLVSSRGSPLLPTLARAAIPLACAALIVAPWTARNYQLAHKVIPVGIGGGVFLWIGTLPTGEGNAAVISDPADKAAFDRYLEPTISIDERIAIDAAFGARGKERIRQAPGQFVKASLVRGVRLWVATHSAELASPPRLMKPLMGLLTVVSLALAAASGWLLRGSFRWLFPFAVVPLYVTLVHMPIGSGARYAIPAWPCVLCLACAAIAAASERLLRPSPAQGSP